MIRKSPKLWEKWWWREWQIEHQTLQGMMRSECRVCRWLTCGAADDQWLSFKGGKNVQGEGKGNHLELAASATAAGRRGSIQNKGVGLMWRRLWGHRWFCWCQWVPKSVVEGLVLWGRLGDWVLQRDEQGCMGMRLKMMSGVGASFGDWDRMDACNLQLKRNFQNSLLSFQYGESGRLWLVQVLMPFH